MVTVAAINNCDTVDVFFPLTLTLISVGDKDSLFDQTSVRVMNLLGPSMHFFVKSSISKNLIKSV